MAQQKDAREVELPDPNRPDENPYYPKVLYHEDSTEKLLIWKIVANAEEELRLGSKWGNLSGLGFETAPGAEPEGPDAPKVTPKAPATKAAAPKGAA